MIYGSLISFLIGGGCDISVVYVELLVDGFGLYRTTGNCEERMTRKSFNVSAVRNRAGQLRVVDAGVSKWGHINIDDIQFDWDVRGGQINSSTNATDAPIYGGNLETSHNGAVYLFRRHQAFSNNDCVVDIGTCQWSQQAKVTASDKRAYDAFGTSIALNDDAGILVVGSPYSRYLGFYKDYPSVYPYVNSTTGAEDVFGLKFPAEQANMTLFQQLPDGYRASTGAYGVWQLQSQTGFSPDARVYEDAGAVYLFVRDPETLNAGSVTANAHWYNTETVKVQPGDEFARDYFGSSVAISNDLVVVGSPGQDGLTFDAGALYLYKSGFASISFSQVSRGQGQGLHGIDTG